MAENSTGVKREPVKKQSRNTQSSSRKRDQADLLNSSYSRVTLLATLLFHVRCLVQLRVWICTQITTAREGFIQVWQMHHCGLVYAAKMFLQFPQPMKSQLLPILTET